MGQMEILKLLKDIWPLWLDPQSIMINSDMNQSNADKAITKLAKSNPCEIEIKYIKVQARYGRKIRFIRYKKQ